MKPFNEQNVPAKFQVCLESALPRYHAFWKPEEGLPDGRGIGRHGWAQFLRPTAQILRPSMYALPLKICAPPQNVFAGVEGAD